MNRAEVEWRLREWVREVGVGECGYLQEAGVRDTSTAPVQWPAVPTMHSASGSSHYCRVLYILPLLTGNSLTQLDGG